MPQRKPADPSHHHFIERLLDREGFGPWQSFRRALAKGAPDEAYRNHHAQESDAF
jgi:hypothetical protein